MKFSASDFSLGDAPQLGEPFEVDSDQIKTLIENSQCCATLETADRLEISKSSVENHLHHLMFGFPIS